MEKNKELLYQYLVEKDDGTLMLLARFSLASIAYNHLLGFKNFVDNKLPRVTKSFVNKLFNKL
jgi:hypothetical protein